MTARTPRRTPSGRRNAICGAVLVAGALLPATAGAMPRCDDPCARAASTPAVNMEAVLKAAQWDPRKPGQGITPGAKPSVLLVERALAAKGYLSKASADGHFGSTTVAAYAAWQRRLGLSGLAATGLPGKTSLIRLGARRFAVTAIVEPGARTTYAGRKVNVRTQRMLKAAARTLSARCTFVLTQGSYNPGGVDVSGGTHDGGGVADIALNELCGKRRPTVIAALRQVGFAAWYRPKLTGKWNAHIHVVAISDPDLSTAAQHQAGDYYEGRNGLADRGPDEGPKVPKRTWEEYLRSR